ncbi:chaplin family protein [Streptomyces sp. NPDC060064]|uniref:chaplin family protein n=1 Tax=Streptomyces sp. NPDC060064 TaxID=3347049 RepID=UPI0036C02D07
MGEPDLVGAEQDLLALLPRELGQSRLEDRNVVTCVVGARVAGPHACGNSLDLIGLLNPSFGNTCTNGDPQPQWPHKRPQP